MLLRRCLVVGVFSIIVGSSFGQDQRATSPGRDSQVLEILGRVVQANGGSQALANVHDITEKGEITFHGGGGAKGPLTIRMLGGNHFHMEADLPNGKSSWTVSDGGGSKKEGEKVVPLSRENALNLGNLTYPIGHVEAALSDSATTTSFVGIEKREARSVYRLRLKGHLGLASEGHASIPVVKDMLIDALTFDIVSVEDRPFVALSVEKGRLRADTDRPFHSPPRAIEFSDFRVVNGVRLPFSVKTKLLGQLTLSMRLDQVTFNNSLSGQDFKP
jgi:hypothetical protein